MPQAPRSAWLQFSLRTVLFWIMPYTAVCLLVLTSCREPDLNPDQGVPMFHWVKLTTVGIISGIGALLFWEDGRAPGDGKRVNRKKWIKPLSSPTMTAAPRFRPHWFRFSLRTLFAAVMVFAVLSWWLDVNIHLVRQRQAFVSYYLAKQSFGDVEVISANRIQPVTKVVFQSKKSIPLIWRLLASDSVRSIDLPRERYPHGEVQRLRRLFPEAEVNVY
jgi:hypothetical protein